MFAMATGNSGNSIEALPELTVSFDMRQSSYETAFGLLDDQFYFREPIGW